MPHDLETRANGQASMMYVGKAPWHGLGVSLTAPPTAAEAICHATLDWKVRKVGLLMADERQILPINDR